VDATLLLPLLVLGIVTQVFKRIDYNDRMFAAEDVVAIAARYGFFRVCETHFTSNRAKRIHRESTIAPLREPVVVGQFG
jgi:hypothetical protein